MKRIICFAIALILTVVGASALTKKERVNDKEAVTTAEKKESTTELSGQINSSTQIDSSQGGYPFRKNDMIVVGEKDKSTASGYTPLMKITYIPTENTSYYSEEKKSHSHGPASGGKAHHTVVDFQKEFDKFGAVTLDTNDEKVLYLTFDCGYEHDNLTARVLDTLKEKQVPAAFFCTLDHIKAEPGLITRMIKEGHIVGNHSTTHPSFADISRSEMAEEIEETENYLRENYGYCARFFRFPKGEYTQSSLDLVASLGYMSVFWSVAYDDWDTNNTHGKDYAVEKVMSRLHNGAIILLHSVSRDNAEALGEIIDKARAQGYEFRSLTSLSEKVL